uniref:Nudix hydrolase domain-containing protein n=1 Tax=Cryptomonas curvata TaxID=233186 RepID=A0A7S0M110_9CRYP|mmetsp:Transcript_19669/g.41261  ORF Transcript_19669/g.41261 Transcript_19669/m.41261 type:complete len:219 (+) Transcript_19669:2-658(+)
MGFSYHHAKDGALTLTRWLPETECTLPSSSSHQVGVGICVVDAQDRILVVQERRGPAAARGKNFWKVPTGLVDHAEDLAEAGCREVLEETGVRVAFEGVVAFRQQHRASVEGNTDLFFLCKARPLSSEIQIQESELVAAKWMPVKEFLELPLWPEGSAYWFLNRLAAESFLEGRGPDIPGPRLAQVPLFRPLALPRGHPTRPGPASGPLFIYSGVPRL